MVTMRINTDPERLAELVAEWEVERTRLEILPRVRSPLTQYVRESRLNTLAYQIATLVSEGLNRPTVQRARMDDDVQVDS